MKIDAVTYENTTVQLFSMLTVQLTLSLCTSSFFQDFILSEITSLIRLLLALTLPEPFGAFDYTDTSLCGCTKVDA